MSKYIGDVRIVGGFEDLVCSASWTSTSTILACSADGKVYSILYSSMESTPEVQIVGTLPENINSVAFAGDKKVAVIQSESGEKKFHEIATNAKGTSLSSSSFKLPKRIHTSLSLDKRGARIALSDVDRVDVWSLKAHQNVVSFKTDTPQSVLAWGQGDLLAGGGADGTVLLWHVSEQTAPLRFCVHHAPVSSLAWSPTQKLLASGSHDKSLAIYCTEPRQILHHLQCGNDWITALAFDATGSHLAAGSFQSDRSIRLFLVESAQLVRKLTGHTGGVTCLSFNTAGSVLLSGSCDLTLRLWQLDLAAAKDAHVVDGHDDGVRSVCWRPDGRFLVSGADDNTARIWNGETSELVRVLPGGKGWVNCVAYSPNGDHVACASADGAVRVYDSESGVQAAALEHGDWVQSVAWSHDSQLLVSGTLGDATEPTVWIWKALPSPQPHTPPSDAAPLQLLQKLVGHGGRINSVSVSRDDGLVASASDDKSVIIWSLATGTSLCKITEGSGIVRCVRWAAHSNLLACGWGDELRVFDGSQADFPCVHVFSGHNGSLLSLDWAPDDSMLISSSSDFTVRLWTLGAAVPTSPSAPPSCFHLDSPVYCLSWNSRSGVCCACASGRIVQLGVVGSTGTNLGARNRAQLKWGKSFRKSKKIAKPDARQSALDPISEHDEQRRGSVVAVPLPPTLVHHSSASTSRACLIL